MPGVAAVLTADDYIAEGLGPIPHIGPPVKRRGGDDPASPPYYPLATGHARHVGEGVAFIVADGLERAKDAAERIAVAYDPLPALTGTAELLAEGARTVFEGCPDNECFVHEIGDRAATDAAFAAAHRTVRRRFVLSRVLANAMEPRGCLASYDVRTQRFSLRAPVQHPFVVRGLLAGRVFGLDEQDFHVEVDDVGGSFGNKANLYPEYLLALWAARRLGRAVRWTSERSDGHLSDFHGRDNVADAELALDAEGRFTGLRVRSVVNLGAYLSPLGAGPAVNNLGSLAGVYRTPAAHVEVRGALSNSQPTAPYRGAGRPEAAFVIERLIDAAAEDLAIDRIELRRRNMIGRDELPFATPARLRLRLGAISRPTWTARWRSRKPMASGTGGARRPPGAGFSGSAWPTRSSAPPPPGLEFAEIRFAPSGRATVLCGATTQGQGHATTFAQLLGERLGLAAEDIRFVQGDTDRLAFGLGAGGSRISAMGCAALLIAADKIVEKGKRIAAHLLEAAEDDIAFENGAFAIAGTDRDVSLGDVARAAFQPARLPPDVEPGADRERHLPIEGRELPQRVPCLRSRDRPRDRRGPDCPLCRGRRFRHRHQPAAGQGPGPWRRRPGCGPGADGARGLRARQRPDARRLADGLRPCRGATISVPSRSRATRCRRAANPLGVKGAGEAGTVGALPAVIGAVNDALAPLGAGGVEMPATPERVWRAIRRARA